MKIIKSIFVLFVAAGTCFAQDFSVVDFIAEKLKAGEKNIVLPKGVHIVKKPQTPSSFIVLKDLEDVKIDGNGAELRFCGSIKATMFSVINCKNIAIENLIVDLDPIPFTQGKITKIASDKSWFECEIDAGYRTDAENGAFRMEIYDPVVRKLKQPMTFGTTKQLSPNTFRFTKTETVAKNRPKDIQNERVGDLFCLGLGGGATSFYANSTNGLTYKNITVYSSGGMAFYDYLCSDVVFDSCVITRRDKDDYVARSPRLRSTNADGYHSRSARVGPQIINCTAEYLSDDCVAIECVYSVVVKSSGNRARVVVRDGKSAGIKSGDEVEVYRPDGRVVYLKAKTVSYAGKTTPAEYEFLNTQPIAKHIAKPPRMAHCAWIEFEDGAAPAGSFIAGMGRACKGYRIVGGKFGNLRSRAMLLKASGGVVDGAKIEGCWMPAIKISPELFFLEACHARDVVIKNCDITAEFAAAINIHSPTTDHKDFSPAGAHANILVENNTIRYARTPACLFASIDGLTLKSNLLEKIKPPYDGTNWAYSARKIGDNPPASDLPVLIENCANVKRDDK